MHLPAAQVPAREQSQSVEQWKADEKLAQPPPQLELGKDPTPPAVFTSLRPRTHLESVENDDENVELKSTVDADPALAAVRIAAVGLPAVGMRGRRGGQRAARVLAAGRVGVRATLQRSRHFSVRNAEEKARKW